MDSEVSAAHAKGSGAWFPAQSFQQPLLSLPVLSGESLIVATIAYKKTCAKNNTFGGLLLSNLP